ncbi:MAG: ferritin-like domain-containing protein [Anaerolineae bacterium]|nr:ferritin-like domain-containing protein [Anaerolineae bacterium]
MDRQALIDMLNVDLADEHASVIRYLVHAYQVGESTPFGADLLATAREEMWHMDWIGDVLGELGAEPQMAQGDYPHDPTSNGSLLRSYIAWEKNLIQVYKDQAAKVDDPEIKRMLLQQSQESLTHQRRFEQWLEKLGPAAEEPFTYGEEAGFSPDMLAYFQQETDEHYRIVLQHLRHAFVFEDQACPVSGELELSAMRHMKHLSHFAEELTESGQALRFEYPGVDMSTDVMPALKSDLDLTLAARERFAQLAANPELAEHAGLKNEVENMVTRNEFLAMTVEELMEEAGETKEAEAPEKAEPPAAQTDDTDKPAAGTGFTVGSLIDK